ncbi:hypothetical protein WMY93_019803 [Mugilogobius chulae]|uniref:DUF1279 domain-containing protein n=1 Tax=Mugilogobius chulae TaxID=88201 RepID=A0AAW0NFB7_9GOBI
MWCRLAKPLGKTFITRGSYSFEVPALNKLRNVTLTLHKVHGLHSSTALCRTVANKHVIIVNYAKGQERDLFSSCGLPSDWDRRATIATSLCTSVQSRGGTGRVLTPQSSSHCGLQVSRIGLFGNVSFPSGTMQTRSSSTAAATKHREASDEPSVSHKGDDQTSQEPSSPPPEEHKPNKTQQLKKVFKEYGAVGVSFHVCISLMSLGMFYLLVSSGIDMSAFCANWASVRLWFDPRWPPAPAPLFWRTPFTSCLLQCESASH